MLVRFLGTPQNTGVHSQGYSLWVHGNATKHMAEYLIKQASTGHTNESTRLSAQIMLYDMQRSLGEVTKVGFTYGRILHHGNWDFIISKARKGEKYDVVIHALIKK